MWACSGFRGRAQKDENVIMALWAWGWGGINFPDKMPQLAKCKIVGVSDNRPSASPDLEASQISDG